MTTNDRHLACCALDETLASYVDGEATPQQCACVDAHLAACPACRDRVAGERAAREALRARRESLRVCASEQLRARCARHRRAGGTAGGRGGARLTRRAILPLSLAATVVLAVAGAFVYSVNNPVEALAAQYTVDHVKCFELTAQKRITDAPAAARRWADARGWPIGVPPGDDSAALELVGVRRCLSTEGTSAHVMYRWRGEPLSLYIMPKAVRGVGTVQRVVEKLGHGAVIWSKGTRTYLVMTHGRPEGFDTMAAYMRRHAE